LLSCVTSLSCIRLIAPGANLRISYSFPLETLNEMKKWIAIFSLAGVCCSSVALADWADAACEIYPKGEDHTDVLIPCTFGQRQGYILITRSDGVKHDLSPVGDDPGNFVDQDGRRVYRQSGLGDQGQIFRFPDESVYVYWNTKILEPVDENNPTWPFTTDEYDATALLRCKAAGDSEFGSCPAGVLRMEDGQGSVVIQNQLGETFTINFMKDYVNATNREAEARLEGDTWIVEINGEETYEVPLAMIEGG